MDFNSPNWDKTQTVSLTRRLALKKDKKFAGKLKVMATLVKNGVASQLQEACQYNVRRNVMPPDRKIGGILFFAVCMSLYGYVRHVCVCPKL
ncbi:hypothetical protein DPMN_098228 [Dreissena polymorpha]|uniref:Uncharacterized protein n=1 Tax=Dreissena polymorpha TaxID=45954 RepID=A0A9D4R644_DREPO|nr:hypothetical protein DPMN_098228 [Dreissena polymorpha]